MNKNLVFFAVLACNAAYADYKPYNPQTDSQYFDGAIMGACSAVHKKLDMLESYLKANIDSMNQDDADAFSDELRETQKQRWMCIEKELNGRNITLNLNNLFKQNGLE